MVYMLTFGDIWGILMVNVTIYSIHGSYGNGLVVLGKSSPETIEIFPFNIWAFPVNCPVKTNPLKQRNPQMFKKNLRHLTHVTYWDIHQPCGFV